jgi:uroporphyrinogen decarboxylase
MNSKERVHRAIYREPVDRVPLDCWLHEKRFCDRLEADYGTVDKFMDEYNIDLASCFVSWPNQFGEKDERYYHQRYEIEELPDLQLEDPRDPKWLAETDWHPIFRGVNVRDAVERYGGDRFIAVHMWGMVEGTSSFLGIENCWLNLSAEPELMGRWMNKYAHWLADLAESCIDAGADMVRISDDLGQNDVELFPPAVINELIIPNLKIVFDRIRAKGAVVAMHSDGYIMSIMDQFIDLGVQVLHPCQESAGMDQAYIKETYGDKLVMHGGLDVMDMLLNLEGDALMQYIRKQFEICKPGGGFIYNGSHLIQPDIAPAKLCSVYELANELAPY